VTAPIRTWLVEPPPRDVLRVLERLARTPDVHRIAVMPDVHLAHDVCIGVATATRCTLFPEAVGGDIGCGIAAARFVTETGEDADAGLLDDQEAAARVFDELYRRVPQARQRSAARPLWPSTPGSLSPDSPTSDGLSSDGPSPDGLGPDGLSHPALCKLARREGSAQLGTLGRGNHFLELQGDDRGALWVMVHTGSRAMGPAIRDWHLARASRRGTLRGLDVDSEEGRAYLADMRWALAYAEANRRIILRAVSRALETALGVVIAPGSRFDCHHNFVRCEPLGSAQDGATASWVHRKGAISAAQDEPGIIAGSMGAPSYHVSGRGCADALCSSSHGAGRVMSRTLARRRISLHDLDRQMRGVWFDHRRAGRLRDEAPAAYKDIEAVMRAQCDLTRIARRLRPRLSFKGV
jgi:tRNA-splicing ligase RtcB (3'-phosphate/5'-hydroxy nucleic acid ligase)